MTYYHNNLSKNNCSVGDANEESYVFSDLVDTFPYSHDLHRISRVVYGQGSCNPQLSTIATTGGAA